MAEWAQFRIDASQHVARKSGQSAVAAAAYRAGERLIDERTGQVHDYTLRYGVVHAEIVMPEAGGPAWTREQLWNAAEAAEKRKDGRTARKVELALPADITDEQRLALARAWAHEIANLYGVAVDFAIHRPDKDGDQRNHHMHALMTTRKVSREGLGEKAHLELSNADQKKSGLAVGEDAIRELRCAVADRFNAECARMGIPLSVDPRSYAARGIDLEPTKHVGVYATNMERRGLQADRVTEHEDVRRENAKRIRQRPEIVLDRLTGHRSGFTLADVAKELNRYIDDAQELQNLLARLRASPELVRIAPEQKDAAGRVTQEARYSTRDPEKRAQQAERRAAARADLKARYRAYREEFYSERRRAQPAEREQAKTRYRAITEAAREARAAVRAEWLPEAERKARLSVIAAQAVQAHERLRAELAEQRRQNRPKDYREWVADRAQEGDAAAISQVRGWAYRDRRLARAMAQQAAAAERGNGMRTLEPGAVDPASPREFPASAALRMTWTVDRRTGDVTYRIGEREAFTDRGSRLDYGQGRAQADAIEAGLRLAMQKFGPRLDVHGSEEFKRQAVEVAVRRGLNVEFSDRALQAQADALRRQVAAERDQARPAAPAARPGKPASATALEAFRAARDGGEEAKQAALRQFPELAKAFKIDADAQAFAVAKLPEAGRARFLQDTREQIEKDLAAGRFAPPAAQARGASLVEVYRATRDVDAANRKLAVSQHPEIVKAFAYEALTRARLEAAGMPAEEQAKVLAAVRQRIEQDLAAGRPLPEIQRRVPERVREVVRELEVPAEIRALPEWPQAYREASEAYNGFSEAALGREIGADRADRYDQVRELEAGAEIEGRVAAVIERGSQAYYVVEAEDGRRALVPVNDELDLEPGDDITASRDRDSGYDVAADNGYGR